MGGTGGMQRERIGVDRIQAVWQGPRDGSCCHLRTHGSEGNRPGGKGGASRMCWGPARGVGTRARSRLVSWRARAAPRSMLCQIVSRGCLQASTDGPHRLKWLMLVAGMVGTD